VTGTKDEGEAPIDVPASESLNAIPVDQKPIDKNAPRCIACGHYHGSVNAGMLCLEREILRLRSKA
jgi:ribosomal protein S14